MQGGTDLRRALHDEEDDASEYGGIFAASEADIFSVGIFFCGPGLRIVTAGAT